MLEAGLDLFEVDSSFVFNSSRRFFDLEDGCGVGLSLLSEEVLEWKHESYMSRWVMSNALVLVVECSRCSLSGV